MSILYIRDKNGNIMPVPTINAGISVTGASAGQTIKIAEVDKDGNPVAWEAVDFPDSGGNVDLSGYLQRSELDAAVEDALAQAKTSGEFDGKNGVDGQPGADGKDGEDGSNGVDGKDGYSPVRGTDYWTDADKAEIKAYVDEAILGGAW